MRRETYENSDFYKVEKVSDWIDANDKAIITVKTETAPKNEFSVYANKVKHTVEIDIDTYDNREASTHPHTFRDTVVVLRHGERYEISVSNLLDMLKYMKMFGNSLVALDTLHKEGKRIEAIAQHESVKQMNGGLKVIIQREHNKLENGIEPKGRWVARSKVSNVYLGHDKYRHDLKAHVENMGYHPANIEVIGD